MRALAVGLTGGIGAGKSLALAEAARLGAAVMDADEIARAQARKGGAAYKKIVAAFGRGILDGRGEIDRARLAEKVFSAASRRRRLEKITHPLVLEEMSRRMKAVKKGVVYAAVPLLFEAGLEGRFDLTMTIEAPVSVRGRRAARRDRASLASVEDRMRAQLSERERSRRADIVIRNEGSKPRFLAAFGAYHAGLALLSHGAAQAAS